MTGSTPKQKHDAQKLRELLFAARPISKWRMSEIAAVVGLSVPSIHAHTKRPTGDALRLATSSNFRAASWGFTHTLRPHSAHNVYIDAAEARRWVLAYERHKKENTK